MSLNDVVNVQISRATVFPSQLGFGIPLVLGYHTLTGNLLDKYGELSEVSDAGHALNSPIYRCCQAQFSQNPKPVMVCVGRRTSKSSQVVTLQPLVTAVGYIYKFDFIDSAGLRTPLSYTNGDSETPTTIAVALASLLDGIAVDATITQTDDVITITADTAGLLFDLDKLPDLEEMAIANLTPDAGIANDLAAIATVDNRTWYGLLLESNGAAEILAAAGWAEAQDAKLFGANTSDSECADNEVTDDVMSELKAAAYARTLCLFSQNRLLSYSAAAWLGKMLPGVPGAANWAFQTLNGITVDRLREGQVSNLHAKFCNTYVEIGGLNCTQNGWVADHEFADTIHGSDNQHAKIQEGVFGDIYNASNTGSKIPMTDDGVAIVQGRVLAVLGQGVKDTFLAKSPAPTCTVPKVADVSPADRAARQLAGIKYAATLAGGINKVKITGVLSV